MQDMMTIKNHFMEEINKMENTEQHSEQHWMGSWSNSIDNIKQLYTL